MTGNYLLADSKDWADEFNVYFLEILSEDEYQMYKAAKDILGSFYGTLWFGTNEGWEGDFDFLDFDPQPITEEEKNFLLRSHIYGEDIMYRFIDQLADKFTYYNISTENPYDMSLDAFKEACTKLHNLLEDDGEED